MRVSFEFLSKLDESLFLLNFHSTLSPKKYIFWETLCLLGGKTYQTNDFQKNPHFAFFEVVFLKVPKNYLACLFLFF
jgi:hypothetical protein